MKQILYILTGPVQSGKTRYLERVINYVCDFDQTVAGVIAPGVWQRKKKLGIDNVLLPDGKKLHLAVERSHAHDGPFNMQLYVADKQQCYKSCSDKPHAHNKILSQWKFDVGVLQKVNSHFDKLYEQFQNSQIADFVIVDELGPLEFEHNKGLTSAIKLLEDGLFKHAIIVVRSHLVDIAKDKFKNIAQIMVINPEYNLKNFL